VIFDLPPVNSPEDAAKIASAVLTAVANGELTPADASEICKLIDTWVKAFRQLRSAMDRREHHHLERTDRLIASLDRIAERSGKRDEFFAPFPRFTQGKAREMSDEELIYALLGVRT
jgi:hypothetical protein